ncbi:helix-turn-helix domain-containing protein [Streptomyces sp. NPDC056831]|uniref:helix-turn-helix domain-containing protein n=1 Tax=Streptomyces sp. NPDC056831 TaxID=3345954 RepID=UPI003690772D
MLRGLRRHWIMHDDWRSAMFPSVRSSGPTGSGTAVSCSGALTSSTANAPMRTSPRRPRGACWRRASDTSTVSANESSRSTSSNGTAGCSTRPLNAPDAYEIRLRETLQLFLATGCSYTASRQILHKNTVQYRIRKAEEAMGHPLHERRTDLEVALLAVQHLGSPLLRTSPS